MDGQPRLLFQEDHLITYYWCIIGVAVNICFSIYSFWSHPLESAYFLPYSDLLIVH